MPKFVLTVVLPSRGEVLVTKMVFSGLSSGEENIMDVRIERNASAILEVGRLLQIESTYFISFFAFPGLFTKRA
jgi:hypothetical protein